MVFDVEPATADRFPDVATMLAPRNPDAPACWCLTYRLPSAQNSALAARDRPGFVERLCAQEPPPGILAYDGGEVVGWCGVAPRSELHSLGATIPWVDDLPVWSAWCFRVRAGHRRQGVAQALLEGAVEHANRHGAPAIEGYPVDNDGRRINLTLAFVGSRAMFERVGFTKVADTGTVRDGVPRVVMRRLLDPPEEHL